MLLMDCSGLTVYEFLEQQLHIVISYYTSYMQQKKDYPYHLFLFQQMKTIMPIMTPVITAAMDTVSPAMRATSRSLAVVTMVVGGDEVVLSVVGVGL